MITYRSPQEIEKIRVSARLVAATIQYLAQMIEPGITTADIDRAAEAYIRKHGGRPAFKGYRSFPATLCTSINAEVVHGIPSKKRRSRRFVLLLLAALVLTLTPLVVFAVRSFNPSPGSIASPSPWQREK